MTDEELKQLVASNARTAQAMLDNMAEARLEREQLAEGIQELRIGNNQMREMLSILVNVQEGIANLLASLDSDRPTILRKLTSIENKVDRLLEQNQNEGE